MIQLNKTQLVTNPKIPPYSAEFLMDRPGSTNRNGISEIHKSQGFICSKAIPVNRPAMITNRIFKYLLCK